MLKTIVKKFLQSKLAGLTITAFTGWRLWLLVSSIVGGYIFVNKHKLSKANKQINALTVRLALADLSNYAYQLTQDALTKANQDCVLNNQANDKLIKNTKTKLQTKIKKINEHYKTKTITIKSDCADTIVDDNVMQLLKQNIH